MIGFRLTVPEISGFIIWPKMRAKPPSPATPSQKQEITPEAIATSNSAVTWAYYCGRQRQWKCSECVTVVWRFYDVVSVLISGFCRGIRRFDRRKCSSSSNYRRWHCAEEFIWIYERNWCGRRNIMHKLGIEWMFWRIRFVYHLHLDEFWLVIGSVSAVRSVLQDCFW